MTSNQPHDRESLSALFDGELHGDAARFAHKRLAQDPQWRQACSSWQLAGDVLRGRATAAAPAGFADQVQRALAREAAAPMEPAAGVAPRRGWIGGAALAASVAVAAWFVASPFDEPLPSATPATVVTTTPAPAVPGAAAPLRSPPRVAAIEPATREARSRRALSRPVARAAVSATNAPSAPASTPGSITASAGIGNSGIDPAALVEDPFRLPKPPAAVTRPWPRAVLPDYPVGGAALTARYRDPSRNPGASAADSPTFYPFEPRLPPDAGAPTPSDAQRP